jgi:hypothetical protein
MVCEQFLVAVRESRSIVGWVEKRNPTPLTMRSKVSESGFKDFQEVYLCYTPVIRNLMVSGSSFPKI